MHTTLNERSPNVATTASPPPFTSRKLAPSVRLRFMEFYEAGLVEFKWADGMRQFCNDGLS